MCTFLSTSCMQIICKNFFAKLVQFAFLCHGLSKKTKNYQNLTTESGSKQKFNIVTRKSSHSGSVPEDSYRRKGRTKNILKKSENFNSLRPILCEICKKTTKYQLRNLSKFYAFRWSVKDCNNCRLLSNNPN